MILSENSGKGNCTSLPHFWSSVQSTGYRPQVHFQYITRIIIWRPWHTKEQGKGGKSFWKVSLQPEIWLNLIWSVVWSKRKSWRNLGLSWNFISEHLFQFPPPPFGSVFWYHCSSLIDFRSSWLSSRQMLAGELRGEATEEEKPLLRVLHMQRKL